VWVHNQYSQANPGPITSSDILLDVEKFILESESTTIRTGLTGHAIQKHLSSDHQAILTQLSAIGPGKIAAFTNIDDMTAALTEFVLKNRRELDSWYPNAQINDRFDSNNINYSQSREYGIGYGLDTTDQFSMLFPSNKAIFRIEKTPNGMTLVTGFPEL